MFANFTEETATDSAGTLTLSGLTTGMIPFSASFADGDLVSYVAEDATNKVAGIGTYNSAANTITRNDTWNYNGTVVDKNPATNITLSGTVTVRCDVVSENFSHVQASFDWSSVSIQLDPYKYPPSIVSIGDNKGGRLSNSAYILQFYLFVDTLISNLGVYLSASDIAATEMYAAIYSAKQDGSPDQLIASTSSALDASSTGAKLESLANPLLLRAGIYFSVVKVDSTIVRFGGANTNGYFTPTMYARGQTASAGYVGVGAGPLPITLPTSGWNGENGQQVSVIYS